MRLAPLILVLLLACGQTPATAQPAVVDVTLYGARPDGSGDSGPAFVRAAATLDLRAGGRIVAPPGVYNFDTTFDIPKFMTPAVVEFVMVGATLKTTKPIAIFRRLPADQKEAMQMIGAVFLITGGRFVGTGLPGQIGLEFATTYSSIIRATQFEQLDIGFDGYFNLDLRFENVRAALNRSIDLRVQSGRGKWPDADRFNSGSNHTTFEGVRVYGAQDAFANIAVLGASGVSIRNCIIEGRNPVNGIYFDNEGAIVQTFIVENLHSESTPQNAIITLKGTKPGGVYRISTVFLQTAHTLLDARELGASRISIEDIPYVAPLKSAFKLDPSSSMASGGSWRFVNWPAPAKDARWWSGGIVPGNLTQY
jgi:hypothetical protein